MIALEWLHECCMGYLLGRKPGHENLCFPSKVAAAGNERYLLCAAGAAGVVSCANCSSYAFSIEWLFLCP